MKNIRLSLSSVIFDYILRLDDLILDCFGCYALSWQKGRRFLAFEGRDLFPVYPVKLTKLDPTKVGERVAGLAGSMIFLMRWKEQYWK